MIALGFGPTYLGIASDVIASTFGFNDEMGLRIALTSVSIATIISIIAFLRLSLAIHKDWENAQK